MLYTMVLHRCIRLRSEHLGSAGALDLVVAALSAMAARGLRRTAISMNQLNSHCSDIVITMDIVRPFPRAPFHASLASYRLDLRASRAPHFSPPFPVHSSLPLSFLLLLVSLCGPSVFPRFWPRCILHAVNREIASLTITSVVETLLIAFRPRN